MSATPQRRLELARPASTGGARWRSFTWEDPACPEIVAARESLPGLQYMQGVMEGLIPAPPVARMLGLELVELGEGRAVFALAPAEWMYNPLGSVHGGVMATLLDTCMGCAVHTMLAAGMGYTTSDLQVRYVRGLRASSGRALAEGNVVHLGKRTATVEGRMFLETDERLIAHASSGCVILPGG